MGNRKSNAMKYLYIFLLILCSIPIGGAPVTPEAALKRLHSQNISHLRGKVKTSQYRIQAILTDSCGNNTVYLFDSEDGFVVTPADELSLPYWDMVTVGCMIQPEICRQDFASGCNI